MTTTKLVRDGFTCPMPRPGDGTKILVRADGSLYCSWDRPAARMALDSAIVGGPKGSPNYADDDPNDVNAGGDDTEDQVRQLLVGKLSPEDLDALCDLIFPDDTAAMPAQDRGRRPQARDRMPSMATMQRLVAQGAVRRAAQAQQQTVSLMQRFPALKNARVV